MKPVTHCLVFGLLAISSFAFCAGPPQANTSLTEKLRAAAAAGRIDEVKALIRKGAFPEAADSEGRAALYYAVRGDRVEVVRELLRSGANPNRPDYINRKTPLTLAKELKRHGLVKLLEEDNRQAKERLDAETKSNGIFFEAMTGDTKKLNELFPKTAVRSRYGEHTLLRNAVIYGHPTLAKKLLAAGADPNVCDETGMTLVSFACSGDKVEMLKLLLDAGAEPFSVNQAGRSPLMQAVIGGNVEAVKLLLATKLARVEYADDEGDTALSLAEFQLAGLPADVPKRKRLAEAIELLKGGGAKPVPLRHLRPLPKSGIKEVDAVCVQDLRAGKNPDMRYALIGPRKPGVAPRDGYKLLLLLPGGTASPQFHPFCTKIAHYSAGDDYLVAQLIAPVWSPKQSSELIWPTKLSPAKGMKFTTEEFVNQVVKDVRSTYKIDARYVFALGYSSGGPPVYTITLKPDSPIRGAFVAMSIFRPMELPDLAGAKGKAFYVLHSPEDFIKIAEAEQARDDLGKVGGVVTFATYKGGHGWRSPVYETIRTGLHFLEQSTSSR